MREEFLDIKQIPEQGNQQAVVVVTIKDENGSRQAVGAVCNNNKETVFDPQAILDKATRLAFERIRKNNIDGHAQSERVLQEPEQPTSVSDNKKKEYTREHKTARGSATDNQLQLLNTMAIERKQDLASVTTDQFGLQPNELSSAQAHRLIGHFKETRG